MKAAAIVLGLVVLLGLGYAAGSLMLDDDNPSNAVGTTTSFATGTTVTRGESGGQTTAGPVTSVQPGEGSCNLAPGEPFVGGPSSTLQELGDQGGVLVEGAIYPRPDYEGNPWSQWGQGLLLSDGRFLSAIGDHLGVDGNSYIYEYDPSTGTLATLGDVLSYVDHEPGSFGYGKVHGQIVAGACGEAYLATYWGTRRELEYSGSYQGDVLLRVDPSSRTITNLDVPVANHGVPSLAGDGAGLVFGEALDPTVEDDVDGGPFFVYDTGAEQVLFTGPDGPHIGYRNIMVDGSGRAYYSMGGGELAVYDPETNELSTHSAALPGEWLRASTAPTADGRVFGVTDEEEALFVMEPSGEIRGLGTADGYTASLAAHPDGDRFFYIPEAHGGAWELGAPLIAVDAETGEQTVVVELNSLAEEGLGLRLGGTYGLAVHPSGDRVYIGMNAGATNGEDNGFGEVVLLIVHLP